MDNFFEILIYVIIIISFLSSIFKKKKKQPNPSTQAPQQEEYTQADVYAAQTKPKEEYDVLKEIEDFFKVGSEPPRQEIPVPQEQPKKVTQIEEHTLDESWHTPTASEHIADDWEHKKTEVKKRVALVDSGIEKQAAKFEESLVKIKPIVSELTSLIKTKFKNPSSLKEYIIFSEVLGKPKALRPR